MLTRRRTRVVSWFGAVGFGAFCALSGCGGRSDTDFDDTGSSAGSPGSAGTRSGSGGGGASSSTGGSGQAGTSSGTGGRPINTGGAAPIGGTTSAGGAIATGGAGPIGGSTAVGGAATGGFGGFGGGPGACVECISTNCPQAQECLSDPACIEGAICGATSCVDQGAGAATCWLGCFGGDIQRALAAYGALTCVVDGCGMPCASGFGQ